MMLDSLTKQITRRGFLVTVGAATGHVALPRALRAGSPTPSEPSVLRIGYQRFGNLNVLKALGSLDKQLAAQGTTVQWTLFPAGPQLLEALNVGSIDFGTTGEAPPIFAQAAGAPLVYIAAEPVAPRGEAIIVPTASSLHHVTDLKGKKVAFNKGSNVHYLVVQALAAAGLHYSDIEPAYLVPADARAAFERGSVDAWAIWDPYLAVEQGATPVRTLADGEGLVANRQFYLASRALTTTYPGLVKTLVAALQASDRYAHGNTTKVAAYLSPEMGIPVGPLRVSLQRARFGATLVDAYILADQQRIADTFYRLGLIPRSIRVADAAWTPSGR